MAKLKDSKGITYIKQNSSCVVIVAHPDDETLWCGGLILMHPDVKWTIVTLCRKSDLERLPKFQKAIKIFGAEGVMGDLNDGPDQTPLDEQEVQDAIMNLLGADKFNLILTHSTTGEYTRHLRHEETAKAVLKLWNSGRFQTEQIWSFDYEDGDKKYLPRSCPNADLTIELPDKIWMQKYEIITEIYGFSKDSWEAKTTPQKEAFWIFRSADGIKELINTRSEIK